MARNLMACLSAVLALSGCAALGPAPSAPPPGLFHDAAFTPPATPVRAADALALSPAMREFLERVRPRARQRGAGFGLVDGLLESGVLKLDYDAQVTRNAAEAFAARSGNCLSLVLLTAALAQELGVPVAYHQVESAGLWARDGNLLMSVGHVNISLARDRNGSPVPGRFGDVMTVDFQPDAAARQARSWLLEERRILAMYLGNRAAEHLVDGRTDSAYWHARAAVETDPGYADAVNMLGVVYVRHGLVEQGVAALRHAVTLDPAHAHALGNLADGLDRLGRADEAGAVRAVLARVQAVQPFQDYDAGLRALAAGDFERARRLLEREWRRNGLQFHELHLNLARVYGHFGDVERARRHLELAQETSTTRAQQALYKGKLERLRQTTLH